MIRRASFDIEALKAQAAALPSMDGLDLVPMVTTAQRFDWDETSWAWSEGYGRQRGHQAPRGRHRLRREAQHPAPPRRPRLQGHGGARHRHRRGHPGAAARRRVPVQRPGRPGRDRRIRRAGHPRAAGREDPDLRHLPRPPDAGARRRREDREDAPGPPRREPPGEGPHHRQGGDRVHEPRLRGRPRHACRPTPWRRMSRCSTAPIAASR